MDEKYNAIVLRATNYRDSDKILNLFTLENGVISASLKGVNKPNSKLKFAGEPFMLGEFVLTKKSDRRTVLEVNQIDSFYGIRLDTDKFTAGCALMEFISLTHLDGMQAYDIFLALVKTLKIISEKEVSPKLMLVVFYSVALKHLGYELSLENCARCQKEIKNRAFFSFSDGISACVDCAVASDTEIRFSTYKLLKECQEASEEIEYDRIKDIEFSEFALTNALKFLEYVIRENTGAVIKSHKLLT